MTRREQIVASAERRLGRGVGRLAVREWNPILWPVAEELAPIFPEMSVEQVYAELRDEAEAEHERRARA